MVLTREQEVDAAFALASLPSVVGVFVLVQRRADVASEEDAYMLAILLRPYSATMMVEAHYRLLAVVGRKLTGKVIYVAADVEPLPAFVGRARRITLTAAERDVAAARAPELEAEARYQRLEETERTAMEAAMTRALTNEVDAPVAISLDSGEFEIVRDPFPAPKDRHPRVLLVDDDEREAPVLRVIERIEIVHVHERRQSSTSSMATTTSRCARSASATSRAHASTVSSRSSGPTWRLVSSSWRRPRRSWPRHRRRRSVGSSRGPFRWRPCVSSSSNGGKARAIRRALARPLCGGDRGDRQGAVYFICCCPCETG